MVLLYAVCESWSWDAVLDWFVDICRGKEGKVERAQKQQILIHSLGIVQLMLLSSGDIVFLYCYVAVIRREGELVKFTSVR